MLQLDNLSLSLQNCRLAYGGINRVAVKRMGKWKIKNYISSNTLKSGKAKNRNYIRASVMCYV